MLLQLKDIKALTELSIGEIEFAFARNGYPSEKFLTTEFIGMTPNGSFAYQCTYTDMDTGSASNTRAYVYYNNSGTLMADY